MTVYLSDQEFTQLKQSFPDIAADRCPTCKDKGTYRYWGDENVCDCRQQKNLNVLYCHAGIGALYQRLDWDDLTLTPEQVAPIREYATHVDRYVDKGIGLFISGTIGSGKTLLSNLVLKQLVKTGLSCYFTTFAQTIEAFTSTWGSPDEKSRFADRFMNTTVLCLDDLGREFRSSNNLRASTFDHILRTRVFRSFPTIITTNLNVDEVRRGYGSGILSLLYEQSIGVHLEGTDFRPQAHQRTITEAQQGEVRPIV